MLHVSVTCLVATRTEEAGCRGEARGVRGGDWARRGGVGGEGGVGGWRKGIMKVGENYHCVDERHVISVYVFQK